MASFCKEIVIEAPHEQVWEAMCDVGAVQRRLVPGHIVDTRMDARAALT